MTNLPAYDIINNAVGAEAPSAKHGPVVQLVRTLACHARGRRFDPVPDRQRTLTRESAYADIAQSVERILGKDEVTSSNLVISSRKIQCLCGFQILRAAYIFYHLKKYRQKYRHLKNTDDRAAIFV